MYGQSPPDKKTGIKSNAAYETESLALDTKSDVALFSRKKNIW